jgi:hypothetical protein
MSENLDRHIHRLTGRIPSCNRGGVKFSKYWTVLKRHSSDDWFTSARIRTASDTWGHMHAGKRPCGALRCDGVTEMGAEGLDGLENAARHDSAARLASRMIGEGLHR